jgi:hypothetical protein
MRQRWRSALHRTGVAGGPARRHPVSRSRAATSQPHKKEKPNVSQNQHELDPDDTHHLATAGHA